MARFKVKEGCTLLYPDGSRRGAAGYVVDDTSAHESHALAGQMDKLEPSPDYISPDSCDFVKRVALVIRDTAVLDEPEAPKKKKAKKKTKKKAAKKASKKSSK